MFRLTREVRFSINDALPAPHAAPTNSYAGYPTLIGGGRFFRLQLTVQGQLQPQTSYLLNIKEIDRRVREKAIDHLADLLRMSPFSAAPAALSLFDLLRSDWSNGRLVELRLYLTPFYSVAVKESEHPMVCVSQKFEFSASHRLHNPRLSDEENRRAFGKCSNPHGHGHNYEVQVTLSGQADEKGPLIDIPAFERIVARSVIERFDHKNLNVELEEFRDLIPSVENIARVIHGLLKDEFRAAGAELASVTVWETPKTWCEYTEDQS